MSSSSPDGKRRADRGKGRLSPTRRRLLKVRGWTLAALTLVIAVSTTILFLAIHDHQERRLMASALLSRTEVLVEHVQALEWESLMDPSFAPRGPTEIELERRRIDAVLSGWPSLDLKEPRFQTVKRLWDSYATELGRSVELQLAGDTAAALSHLEGVLVPRYESLSHAIHELSVRERTLGISTERDTYLVEIGLMLAASLLIAALQGAWYRTRRLANEREMALLVQLHGQQRRLLGRAIGASEVERTRIAADLHDGPIQHLTALTYRIERVRLQLERGDRSVDVETLGNLREDLQNEIGELRHVMASLRPPALDQAGLTPALHDLTKAFEDATGVPATARLDDLGRLAPMVETVIYRLVQEALANVRKHARASHVLVDVGRASGRVSVWVRDDGIGFDTASLTDASHGGHFGLAMMRERVEMAGGTWVVNSGSGSGTEVVASLPVEDLDRKLTDRARTNPAAIVSGDAL